MSEQSKWITRFNIAQRIEHIILILSFTTLGLTGLPQKYPLSPISQAIVNGLGGIEVIRTLHHIAAAIFLIEAVYHLVYAGYVIYVRRREASMVPSMTDAKNIAQALKYNLGISNKAPRMPRYNFMEKMEYWAMLWGLIIMAITGFMLWNPIATASLLPGQFIPAAKVAHGGEAILAVLAIIIWHFYNVHIKQFNKAMFTGKISKHEMVEEHALELEKIEEGAIPPLPPAQVQRQRLMIFAPIALVVSAALLFGVYRFVTFEQTAITTIPPAEQVQEVFSPQTPTPEAPEPTLAPTEATTAEAGQGAEVALTWDATVGALFQQRCAACHGTMGGFSAKTYEDVMKAITAGDPAGSKVIQVQQGAHPGKFQADELELIQKWIQDGAPK